MTLLPKKPDLWTLDAALIDPSRRWEWKELRYALPIFNGHRPYDFAARGLTTITTTSAKRAISDVGDSMDTWGVAPVTRPCPQSLIGSATSTLICLCSATTTGPVPGILNVRDGLDTANVLLIRAHVTNDSLKVFWDGSVRFASAANTIASDGLSHVVVLVNRSATDHEVYVDGQSLGTFSDSLTISPTADQIDIGSFGGTSNAYHGKISQARIYSRALGVGEILKVSADPWAWCRRAERSQHLPAPTRRGASSRRIINVVKGNKYRLRRRLTRGDKSVVSTPGGAGMAASLRENP